MAIQNKMEKNELTKGFICQCGIEIEYPAYVFAHWDEELFHTCDCGSKYSIIKGVAIRQGGCGNQGCITGDRGGQLTNGRCRCKAKLI